MTDLADFADLYRDEINHRDHIRGALSLPFGLLVVLGGLLGQMLRDVWFAEGFVTWLFWSAAGSGGYFFVRATYYLIRSYHGHCFKEMPTAIERRGFRDELRKWHVDGGGELSVADMEYNKWLSDQHAIAAHVNWYTNAAKSEFLFRANGALIFCGILTAMAYIPFVIHDRMVGESPQVVSVIELDSTIITGVLRNGK